MIGEALVNGEPVPLVSATLALSDDGAVRGDGAFETLGVWSGRIFRLDAHLDRLAASLAALSLPPPDLGQLRAEAGRLVEGVDGDAAMRVYCTASGTRVLTMAPQPVRTAPRRLVLQPAPWIRPLGTWGPAGAKTMSYAPNMAASRAAVAAGGDDALLVSLEGLVLEGPTFAVLWVLAGVLQAPEMALGIVDSVSRRTLLQLAHEQGLDCEAVRATPSDLAGASEVLICSSVRDVLAMARVGNVHLPAATPVRDMLSAALDRIRRAGPARV